MFRCRVESANTLTHSSAVWQTKAQTAIMIVTMMNIWLRFLAQALAPSLRQFNGAYCLGFGAALRLTAEQHAGVLYALFEVVLNATIRATIVRTSYE